MSFLNVHFYCWWKYFLHANNSLLCRITIADSCSNIAVRFRPLNVCTPQRSLWRFNSNVKLDDLSAFLDSDTIILVSSHFVINLMMLTKL